MWESSSAVLFRHWPTIFSLLISSVTASCCACSVAMRMFPFFNVARPGQLSSTHFNYFTSFSCCTWCTVVHSIMFIFKSSIARQRFNIRHYVYCLAVLRTISCPVSVQARVYCTSNFTCAFFTRAFHTCVVYMPIPLPAQSIWCTFHAISITCAIHTPKMTITRSFITRALSHPVSFLETNGELSYSFAIGYTIRHRLLQIH